MADTGFHRSVDGVSLREGHRCGEGRSAGGRPYRPGPGRGWRRAVRRIAVSLILLAVASLWALGAMKGTVFAQQTLSRPGVHKPPGVSEPAPNDPAAQQPPHQLPPQPASPQPAVVVDAAAGGLVEQGTLELTGPLAVDGAGRLLAVEPAGDGYAVWARRLGKPGFEVIYRRKAAVPGALAVGPDGTFCVASTAGLDCVDSQGRVSHHRHALLEQVVALAWSPDGHLWALRSRSGDGGGLQLVRAAVDFRRVEPVLSLRDSVQGFPGGGMAAAPDGSVLLPVRENDAYRILRVDSSGRFTRLGDFFHLSGGIAVDGTGTAYVLGVKRPQSLEEQRRPFDTLTVQPAGGGPASVLAIFPQERGGSRLDRHVLLGGDGVFYLTRYQTVRGGDGQPREQRVLWTANLQRPPLLAPGARVIDFRIPFVDRLHDPRLNNSDYAGPLLIAPGQPLVIHGINFEGKTGRRRVLVGDAEAMTEAWQDERITVRIPRDLSGGEAQVRVAIDHVTSNAETLEIKTSDVPGWFQIGSPAMRSALTGNLGIRGYHARIVIEGTTQQGASVRQEAIMDPPGLFSVRLPNGSYRAQFSAAYVYSYVGYVAGSYVGSAHIPVQVPSQSFSFQISDDMPAVVWMPDMLGLE